MHALACSSTGPWIIAGCVSRDVVNKVDSARLINPLFPARWQIVACSSAALQLNLVGRVWDENGIRNAWLSPASNDINVSLCNTEHILNVEPAEFLCQNQRIFLFFFTGSHPFSEAERKQLKNETHLQAWRIFVTLYHQKAYFCDLQSIKVCHYTMESGPTNQPCPTRLCLLQPKPLCFLFQPCHTAC